MRGPGIFWMLQVAAGLSMAGPMFIVGIEFARTGQPVFGALMFAFGLIALFAPNYLVKRIGGPRTWIRRRLARNDASSEADTVAESSDEAADGGDPSGPSKVLERLRNR